MEVFRRASLLYRGAGGRKRGGDLVVHQGGQPARVGRRSRRLGDLLAPAATATSPPLVELFAGESKLRVVEVDAHLQEGRGSAPRPIRRYNGAWRPPLPHPQPRCRGSSAGLAAPSARSPRPPARRVLSSAKRRGGCLYTERLAPLDRRGEAPSKLTCPGSGAL